MKFIEPYYDYTGTIHVHTTASDGGADLADMVKVADDVGLDFLVLGDHNCLNPRQGQLTSQVLVIPGIELTPGYSATYDEVENVTHYHSGPDHLLAIGITEVDDVQENNAQANIDAVAALGGLSFLAHPADYWLPWTDWTVNDFTGIEVWTYLSDWAESTMSAPSLSFATRNPDAILGGPNKQILRRWDVQGQQRRLVGIGSTDTHSKTQIINGQQILVFSLAQELSSLHTHVLLREPLHGERNAQIRQVIEAIRAGRCYIALDARAAAAGFQFWLEAPAQRIEMGQEIAVNKIPSEVTLNVRTPHAAQISAKHNGQPLSHTFGRSMSLSFMAEPGVYRIEANLDGQPWVLSNPIYLRE